MFLYESVIVERQSSLKEEMVAQAMQELIPLSKEIKEPERGGVHHEDALV